MRYQQGVGRRAAVKHGAQMAPWGPQHVSLLSGHPEVQLKVGGYARLEIRSGDRMETGHFILVPHAVKQVSGIL